MSVLQAFPNHRSEGMELRDFFAVACMQALMSNPETQIMSSIIVARWAYELADKMLEARKDD